MSKLIVIILSRPKVTKWNSNKAKTTSFMQLQLHHKTLSPLFLSQNPTTRLQSSTPVFPTTASFSQNPSPDETLRKWEYQRSTDG